MANYSPTDRIVLVSVFLTAELGNVGPGGTPKIAFRDFTRRRKLGGKVWPPSFPPNFPPKPFKNLAA